MDDKIKKFLEENMHNNFFATLFYRSQRRPLTPRELACVVKNIEQQEKDNQPAPAGTVFTLPVGSKIEIRKGIANRFKKERHMPIFFRNLEVVRVINETAKAYKVDVRFVATVATSCHICGLDLDTEVSRACGVGPVCVRKYLNYQRPSVENAKEILEIVDNMCQRVGVVEGLWIPKSQILGVFELDANNNVLSLRKLEEILQAQPTVQDVYAKKQKLSGFHR